MDIKKQRAKGTEERNGGKECAVQNTRTKLMQERNMGKLMLQGNVANKYSKKVRERKEGNHF